MTMFRLLAYVGLGIVSEILVGGYYLLLSRGLRWGASATTFINTIFGYWVLRHLLGDVSGISVMAYGVGNAIGCWILVRRKG